MSMKKILLCISMLFCLSCIVPAECKTVVQLYHQIKGTGHGTIPKNPYQPWFIELDDHVITMLPTMYDYDFNVYDSNGVSLFLLYVPAGTTEIILPSTLTGYFEIRFETATYYYYGFITL